MRTWISRFVLLGCAVVSLRCGSEEQDPFGETGGTRNDAGAAGSTGGGAAGSGNASSGGSAGAGATASGGSAGDGGSAGTPAGGAGGSAGTGNGGSGGMATGGAGGSGGQGGAGGGGDGPCDENDDQCPDGTYCSVGECVPGCKTGGSCASGVCSEDHDCDRCTADAECAEGRLCGSGTCHATCDAAAEEPGCPADFSCCGSRCVDARRDIDHCGGCGVACAATEFCATGGDTVGCAPAVLAEVCNNARAVAIDNGLSGDGPAVEDLIAVLSSGCSPAPTTRVVPQEQADAINPQTGQLVGGGGELVVLAGGGYGNPTVSLMESNRLAPLYGGPSGDNAYGIWRSSDDQEVATILLDDLDDKDLLLFEVYRDALTGTLGLVIYGLTAEGTHAAVWLFERDILPKLATYTDSWYVYEWDDINDDDAADDGDTFTLLASG